MTEQAEAATTSDNPPEKYDRALVAAWNRLLDFNGKSKSSKKSYEQLRNCIILLSVITTLVAVLASYDGLKDSQFIDWPWVGDLIVWLNTNSTLDLTETTVGFFFRVLLVLLPALTAASLAYARTFATTAWVDYRAAAERIRAQIFFYRTQSGPYSETGLQAAQAEDSTITDAASLLNAKVAAITQTAINSKSGQMPFLTQYKIGDNRGLGRIRKPERDLPMMSDPDDYIEQRLLYQYNWYVDRLDTDYKNFRRNFIMIQVVTVIGIVIATANIGLEPFIALTTSLGVALSLWSDVKLHGATYTVFHATALALRDRYDQWLILLDKLPPATEPADEDFRALVEDVERILANERDLWQRQVRELQSRVSEQLDSITPEQYRVDRDKQSESPTTPRAQAAGANGDAEPPLKPDDNEEERP